MTAKIMDWKATELPAFASAWSNFTVVDPDKHGAMVVHIDNKPTRALLLDDLGAACKSVGLAHVGGPLVLIVEMPFVGMNAHQAMDSGRRTGSIPGLVAGYADARVEVVWLYAGTWQAHLKRVTGLVGEINPETGKRGKVERTALKAATTAALPPEVERFAAYQAGRKEQKQAIADGCAMGRWWEWCRP